MRPFVSGRPLLFLLTIVAASVAGGCASAMPGEPLHQERGDLAGFIAHGPTEDLSSAATDMSTSAPTDLAGPHDLAVAVADQAVVHDLAHPITPPDFSQPPPPPDLAPPAGTCGGATCSGGKSCTSASGTPKCNYVAYTPCNGISKPGICYNNAMVWCDVDGTLRVIGCGGFQCHFVGSSSECS